MYCGSRTSEQKQRGAFETLVSKCVNFALVNGIKSSKICNDALANLEFYPIV